MHQTEHLLFATLLQLIVIILAARIVGNLCHRLGQPAAVGEIIAGLLLGPSLFGHFWPELSGLVFDPAVSLPITILSQIGLILLMFQIGSDFEFGHLSHARKRAAVVGIAVASVSAPFCLGFVIGHVSAPILAPGVNRLVYSLFLGVALAITAVPILGRILRELDLTRTPIGAVTIAAAALNDVAGWVLLAGISAYAAAQFSVVGTALQIGGIVAFAIMLWLAGRPAVDWLLRRFPVIGGELSSGLMAATLAVLFACGIATYQLGIFAIFGGFAAGLLYHRHHEFVAAWRRQVGRFVLVFFLPVFFTYTGLRTNLLGLTTQSDWLCDRGEDRAELCRRPVCRVQFARGHRDRHSDEHAGADGADRPQCRLRSGLHPATRVHHAGRHGRGDHCHDGAVGEAGPAAPRPCDSAPRRGVRAMTALDMRRRRRDRFLVVWMVGSALWIAAMLIAEATIRPAPEFAVMAPLVFGAPALALAVGFGVLAWRARR
jgi:Kef-type K+ transport system membrane component KefB